MAKVKRKTTSKKNEEAIRLERDASEERDEEETSTVAEEKETLERRKARFLDALFKTLGCALAARQKTGIEREEWERWLEEDDAFARKIASIREDALDYVEGKMFEEIKSGNAQLIKFFLENKGKKRGYGKIRDEEKDEKQTPFAVLSEDEMEY